MPGSKTERIGTKLAVFRGTAMCTSGGLKKSDLMKNKRNKIVSKKKHNLAKRHSNLPELLRKS